MSSLGFSSNGGVSTSAFFHVNCCVLTPNCPFPKCPNVRHGASAAFRVPKTPPQGLSLIPGEKCELAVDRPGAPEDLTKEAQELTSSEVLSSVKYSAVDTLESRTTRWPKALSGEPGSRYSRCGRDVRAILFRLWKHAADSRMCGGWLCVSGSKEGSTRLKSPSGNYKRESLPMPAAAINADSQSVLPGCV